MNSEVNIGDNIKEVRKSQKMRQQDLAEKCGFSNTTLSAYENNNKTPTLKTIANIAKQLGVSIERLYYGDENNTFISAAPNEGRKIVNAIYFLWEQGVIWYNNGIKSEDYETRSINTLSVYLLVNKYSSAISRLITHLDEFRMNKSTFSDPEGYLEMLLSSVAEEINVDIKRDERITKSVEEKKISSKKGPTVAN